MLRTKKILIKQEIKLKQHKIVINAPATNLSTVKEILKQAMKIARKLEVKVVCVFDQALHAKVIDKLFYNGKIKKKCIQKLWGWVHFIRFVIFL